jgi:LysR family transcriptional regulator, glycine cleavage system transcriptional activator
LPLQLPPLASLRIFDAAARLGSFRKAADELGLTPSAVSHGITALESWLGAKLFHRDGRSIGLTEAGEAFLPYVADALSMIAIGARRISPLQEARRVSMSVAPTFASRWLMPRLPGFQAKHPEVTLRIDTSYTQVLFPHEDVDLAVRMAAAPPPNVRSVLLFRETLLPVATPAYLQSIAAPDGGVGWEKATLIHLGTVSLDWEHWLDQQRLEVQPLGHVVLDTMRLTMEAAVAGLGVALAREPLCSPEIEQGKVVPLGFAPLPIESGYWLTFPAGEEPRRDVMAFLRWLCAEAGRSDELRSPQ